MSWEDLVKNKIFIHLDMRNCGFGPAADPKVNPPNQPWGHKVADGKLMLCVTEMRSKQEIDRLVQLVKEF